MLSGTGGQRRTAAVRTSTATERVRRTREPSPYETIEADEARDHREVESGLLRWTDENDAKIQSRQKKIFLKTFYDFENTRLFYF